MDYVYAKMENKANDALLSIGFFLYRDSVGVVVYFRKVGRYFGLDFRRILTKQQKESATHE